MGQFLNVPDRVVDKPADPQWDVQIGEPVIFVDPVGVPHEALITMVWWRFTAPGDGLTHEDRSVAPMINLVFVSMDEHRDDSYGQQIERATSVGHESVATAHGMFWRKPLKV